MDQRSITVNEASSPLPSSSSSSIPSSSAISVTLNEEPTPLCSSQESIIIEQRQGNNHSALCKWKIHNFSTKLETRALVSSSFKVGGLNWRLLIYPNGDSSSKTGYCSIYLQSIIDTRKKCLTSYTLSIVNLLDESSIRKDSWFRFSKEEKFHGWCDFALISTIVDPKSGFISTDGDVVITADVLVLKEHFRGNNKAYSPVIIDGRISWKVHNFSLFKEKMKTQKIMSPFFYGSDCILSIGVYQSCVNGTDYLSMCLESKKKVCMHDPDRSCWCLFRMSVKTQKPGLDDIKGDSYGRVANDSRGGDNDSLEWNDFMKMSDFIRPELGFLVNDTAMFGASFQILKESYDFTKSGESLGGESMGGGQMSDGYIGKFTWRIRKFTRLVDLSRNRNLFDLCVKSKRFQIGDRDCCLNVYPCPRDQSQSPCQLSLFLEVTDSRNTGSDWSCFVSHRLSVVNQCMEDKSIVNESQNRYTKDAKEWGWPNFVTLSNLFDQDSGFFVKDCIVFSAEVLILKETSEIQDFSDQDMELSNAGGQTEVVGAKRSFTWKIKNFSSFKEIMETRKIFSNFFQAGEFNLRIGVYESIDTFYMFLESDQSAGIDPDKNFWVKYKMGVVNQMNPNKTLCKESTLFTNTWTEFVLPFMKVSDMLEEDAGFLMGDTIVFVCYIMDYSPWFDFSDTVEEFKFNPHANIFTPAQTPFRNNVSAVQHMPTGVGIETSFARPQTVMYNPQAAPIQSPQALIHPNAQPAPVQSPQTFIHPNALLAPIQSPQAFIHPNAQLAAPIQSPQALIHPNTYLAAPIQAPQAFIHPNAYLIETSFVGPQPVMYNPQAAPIQSPQGFIHPNAQLAVPIQSPQAFIHPNAHLYGRPMIMGQHPRQILYMPGYPPERPNQGRGF